MFITHMICIESDVVFVASLLQVTSFIEDLQPIWVASHVIHVALHFALHGNQFAFAFLDPSLLGQLSQCWPSLAILLLVAELGHRIRSPPPWPILVTVPCVSHGVDAPREDHHVRRGL